MFVQRELGRIPLSPICLIAPSNGTHITHGVLCMELHFLATTQDVCNVSRSHGKIHGTHYTNKKEGFFPQSPFTMSYCLAMQYHMIVIIQREFLYICFPIKNSTTLIYGSIAKGDPNLAHSSLFHIVKR